jgi:RNA-directed DNA polymerase
MRLIENVADPKLLAKKFNSVVPKRHSPLWYKQSYEQFDSELSKNLEKLCQLLIEGKFKFSKPKLMIVKDRPLLAICAKDRAVEKSIFAVVAPLMKERLAFPATFARKAVKNEPERSMRQLSRVFLTNSEEHLWAFETDIKKFFSSINHEILQVHLETMLEDRSLDYLFTQIINRVPEDMGKVSKELLWHYEDHQRGVPQGSVLSPLLASIYLRDFDATLLRSGIKYIRYVDDMVVFANSPEEAIEMELRIHDELIKIGLDAHKSYVDEDIKGHIKSLLNPITFVGYEFKTDRVFPSKKGLNGFVDKVENIASNSDSLFELLSRMRNFILGWNAAYGWTSLDRKTRDELDSIMVRTVQRWMSRKKLIPKSRFGRSYRAIAFTLGLPLLREYKTSEPALDEGWLDELWEVCV